MKLRNNLGSNNNIFDDFMHYRSTDGLTIEEELNLMVREAEGRAPFIPMTWDSDKNMRAGAEELR